MTVKTPAATIGDALRQFAGVPFRRQTYRNLAYLALAFPLGLGYFVGVVVGLSLGAGLLVTWFGFPVLVLTVAGATVVAGVEATLARRLVGTDAALPEVLRDFDPGEATVRPGDGALAALKRFLLAPTTWTSVLLVGVRFLFGIVAFVALVTAGSLASSMLAAPVLFDAPHTTYRFGGYVVDTLPDAVVLFVGGVLLTFAALHALNALARLGGLLTAALLDVGGSDE
jgi:hypothetical protein